MDGSRFDGITRALAAGATRRQTLLRVAGSGIAGLLGLAGVKDAAAGCVKPGKQGCKGPKHEQCCKGATCQGGTKDKEGRCTCKGRLKRCGRKCVNTKTDEKNCGGCNTRCQGSNTCEDGKCTSRLGCTAANNICSQTGIVNCPGTTNPECFCITDVHGTHRCSDFTGADCANCTSNADCGVGFACFPVNFGQCSCDGAPGNNGNICALVNCDGISGSGAEWEVRPPLLR